MPRKAVHPVRRLASLAQALSRDGLKAGARKDAYGKLFAKLDGLLAQYKKEVAEASKGILEVQGRTLVVRVIGGEVRESQDFVEAADERSVEADFRAAGRVLTADLARKYADHLAKGDDEDGDGLFEAHVKVAALAQVDGVSHELKQKADELSQQWFDQCRVAVKGLRDDRRAVYDEIKGMSHEPQPVDIKRPRVRSEETEDSNGKKLKTQTRHLMSDGDGNFPVGLLNRWEIEVLDKERARPGFRAWYRNPSRPSDDALVIAYQNTRGQWCRMCPDFLFFHSESDDLRVSLVDPHGHHLADALPKLDGLARFAAKRGEIFHRIESVAQMKDHTLRVLDLTDPQIRKAITEADSAQALYLDVGVDYS